MKQEQIIAKNKLIAEFMGWSSEEMSTGNGKVLVFQTPHINRGLGDTFTSGRYSINKLKFHSSWDWLMPVVKKLDGLNMNRVYPNMDRFWNTLTEVDLPKMWLEVIEFIKGYNQNK